MSGPVTMRAGNAAALAVSTRFVNDRLLTSGIADTSTMPLTSWVPVGRFRSSRASDQSEYTSFPPSDCPTNQDHLRRPSEKGDVSIHSPAYPGPATWLSWCVFVMQC